MEICARNLRSVQPLAALNALESRAEMNERRRFRPGIFVDKLEEEVLCPKPRRPANPSNPARRQRSSTPRSSEAGFEILEIFLSKSNYGDASSLGCSPPYFSGSPPTRAGNPLVRDVQFVRQRAPPSPTGRLQQNVREASRGSSPCVRVEGFASAGCIYSFAGRHYPGEDDRYTGMERMDKHTKTLRLQRHSSKGEVCLSDIFSRLSRGTWEGIQAVPALSIYSCTKEFEFVGFCIR